MGSLRVYNALAERFGGALTAEAVAQGLAWFAEHTADARARPGHGVREGALANVDDVREQRRREMSGRLASRPDARVHDPGTGGETCRTDS